MIRSYSRALEQLSATQQQVLNTVTQLGESVRRHHTSDIQTQADNARAQAERGEWTERATLQNEDAIAGLDDRFANRDGGRGRTLRTDMLAQIEDNGTYRAQVY